MAAAPGKGAGDQPERKKKESILDLGIVDLLGLHCKFANESLSSGKFMDKQIRVKFSGGRECSGVLKG